MAAYPGEKRRKANAKISLSPPANIRIKEAGLQYSWLVAQTIVSITDSAPSVAPKIMRAMGLSFKGLMQAAPAVLVPAIEVPLLLWTREKYIELHPAEVLMSSPTISRASGDPAIAGPFAITILAISALIGVAVFFIARAYLASIENLLADDQRLQRTARTLVVVAVLAQAVGTLGMVTTSYVHLGVSRDVHMISSYVFFSGQSLTIILSGIVCAILRSRGSTRKTTRSPGMLDSAMNGVRIKAAIAISVGAVIYLILFHIKDMPLPIHSYFVEYMYTIWEIIVLAGFVTYLALFAPDLYQAGKDSNAARRSGSVSFVTGRTATRCPGHLGSKGALMPPQSGPSKWS